jgi:hypothetical protein
MPIFIKIREVGLGAPTLHEFSIIMLKKVNKNSCRNKNQRKWLAITGWQYNFVSFLLAMYFSASQQAHFFFKITVDKYICW